ncbi:Cysteine-rich_membrane protein 2 [Hexamita inflata]|uniref:Cysteine-rich membrane protein 2 n=1 Tax=Hexamita inflata TaxID=28002 RepID=A0AA86P0Z0_9EUKA|nr:Cysteine-rich membrane protein 2 [Hexamita inflata]
MKHIIILQFITYYQSDLQSEYEPANHKTETTANTIVPVSALKEPTIKQIFCKCEAPQFNSCQSCCGCVTMFCCGTGLECCCCYGCTRQGCCNVCLAGLLMQISSIFIYGVVAGCIVGLRMMGKM